MQAVSKSESAAEFSIRGDWSSPISIPLEFEFIEGKGIVCLTHRTKLVQSHVVFLSEMYKIIEIHKNKTNYRYSKN